jgi:hypothetical protein
MPILGERTAVDEDDQDIVWYRVLVSSLILFEKAEKMGLKI